MKLLILVLVVIMCACGPGAGWQRPNDMVPEPGVTSERIVDRQPYLDVEAVPSAFRRPDDPVFGRMNLLFSDRGNACVVDDHDFVMAPNGEEWPCKWRHPRGF